MPTPEEWRDQLNQRLDTRRSTVRHFEAYYEGEHRLAFATAKFREAFGDIFNGFSDNWCGVVVDAAVERLEVQGFRFGRDANADDEAWRIWQANDLDAGSIVGHETSIATGWSYLLVAPNPDDEDTPTITVEHPDEVIVAMVPGSPRQRAAAFKKWVDADGYAMATLYLPDGLYKWRSAQKYRGGSRPRWVPRPDEAEADGYAGDNPVGAVPIVPLLNRPTMRGEGRSDIKSVIPQQDAVNKEIADMLVASEFAAYRQRYAAGIDVELDDDGKPKKKVFDPGVDRMFTTGNEEAKFGSFEASDLSNYVAAVEMLVQHIAAQTRTPPHYLLGQSGAFPSGESLKSTETGLVAKVKRKMTTFGESYEETIRLAFRLKGDEQKANAIDAETIWRDPESRTEGELIDGLVKLSTIGVPRRALWERLGASPQQIARWESMAEADGLQAAAQDFTRVFGPNGQGVGPELPGSSSADTAPATAGG